MRLTSTGLGIGNSSPTAKLDVTGTAAISGAVTLSGGTANGVAYLNSSKVLTTGSALTFDGTSLGVGYSSPGSFLYSGLTVGGGTGNIGLTLFSSTTGIGSIAFADSASGAARYAGHFRYLHSSNAFTFDTEDVERMRLTSTGLGIGTSSPSTRLHVVGVAEDTNAASGTGVVRLQGGASVYSGYIGFDASTMSIGTNNASRGLSFVAGGAERARIDSSGNVQVLGGAVVVWAPAPASINTTATLTNANIQAQIINTTGTSYTVTMPLGSTLETLVSWAGTDLGYNFTVINTASGTITMAVNTGVTSLGSLTIATGTSAGFRIRRTAANTFVLYRLS